MGWVARTSEGGETVQRKETSRVEAGAGQAALQRPGAPLTEQGPFAWGPGVSLVIHTSEPVAPLPGFPALIAQFWNRPSQESLSAPALTPAPVSRNPSQLFSCFQSLWKV